MLQSSPILIFLAGLAHAQFPSAPVDLEVVTSELDSDVKLSYKEVSGDLCETTPGVRTFSGYVHLPQNVLSDLTVDFDINTFFLFFEARNDPDNAPLVIYLAGGPGESSTFTAMNSEGGPCFVNLDGNSTTLNPWSFNNHANMLYIDQPVSAGFSYTSLVNGTIDFLTNEIVPLTEYDGDIPESSLLLGQGTFVDPTPWKTTNTSISSAKALWHFAQHWLSQFPEYKSSNKKIGIWGNSHGGYWAPATAAYFDRELKESRPNSPLRGWTIDNVGITNGVIDMELDLPFWPEYNFNNTYKPLITEEIWSSATTNFTKENGCQHNIRQCRAVAAEGDPDGAGTNETVNAVCRDATGLCLAEVGNTLPEEISEFDIATRIITEVGFEPCPYYLPVVNYLNQDWTQKALGVPLNFTYISQAVLASYSLIATTPAMGTGDPLRTGRSNVDYITQNGIKLALVYGDRDARCPWLAAEDFTHNSNYSDSESWSAAGYEYITTNDTYQGGVVKQFDKMSFSRVFQAGHAVNAYQPETVDRIFQRTIFGKDVATGKKDASGGYSSQGPESSLQMVNESLPKVPDTCMVLGSFQDSSPWEPLFELAASQSENSTGDNTGSGSSGESESATESSADSSSTSMSARVQPAGPVALLFFVAAGFSLVV